jgi:glycosyltransferase involved in cell wall biosynthesis
MWLPFLSDTYEVVERVAVEDSASLPADYVTVPVGAKISRYAGHLEDGSVAAIVEGRIDVARIATHRATRVIHPSRITVAPEVLSNIGSTTDSPPMAVLERLIDAGYRIALDVRPTTEPIPPRSDPIVSRPVVIFAAVPLHDVGGGSRGAQLALELVRRGFHVTYVNCYESYEDIDLGLRYIHPNLEQPRIAEFDTETLLRRCAEPGVMIVELPEPRISQAYQDLHRAGWVSVFDMIDDWSDEALGGSWYDAAFERSMIVDSHAITATAGDLALRAHEYGRSDVVVVANAVNETMFSHRDTGRPADLPAGTILGYHGSLYGDWLDWDAITAVATANPTANVVLIGENRQVTATPPANVLFLGLKPQADLYAYVSRFDVGLLPFKINQTTHAVSPLKVYEYLACGVPTAAPPLRALEGMDGVYVDPNLAAAVDAASAAPKPDGGEALIEHSWSSRLSAMLATVGWELPTDVDTPVTIEQRGGTPPT